MGRDGWTLDELTEGKRLRKMWTLIGAREGWKVRVVLDPVDSWGTRHEELLSALVRNGGLHIRGGCFGIDSTNKVYAEVFVPNCRIGEDGKEREGMPTEAECSGLALETQGIVTEALNMAAYILCVQESMKGV